MDINRKLNNDNENNKSSFTVVGYSAGTYPARTLIYHVTLKGIQIGSIFGLFIVTPILRGYKKMVILKAWRYSMSVTPIVGGIFSSSYLYILNCQGKLTIDTVDNRAIRLLKNKDQLLVDQYSIMGAFAGTAIGAVCISPITYSIISSAFTGLVGGMMYYGIERNGYMETWRAYFKALKI